MRIVFASPKGGVGKSSLCYLVALALAKTGLTIEVEDRDPQRSLASWVDAERDGLRLVGQGADAEAGEGGVVSDEIGEAGGEGADYRLIDTRPAFDLPCVHGAIAEADLVVIPTTPSMADAAGIVAAVQMVESFRRPGARVAVVINRLRANTLLGAQVQDVLAEAGVPLTGCRLPERQPIQRLPLLGWAALDGKTEREVLDLALNLVARRSLAGAA